MKMRRVRNDRDQPIWGMSVAIAPIEPSEIHVMAFSLDHSNNVDETLDRCLKSSPLYEPERKDDETDLLNFDMHGVACWKISSAFKTQLFEKNKLMDNEEEKSGRFLIVTSSYVWVLSNADESNYVSESDLVLSKVKFSGESFPKQKVEIRCGGELVKLPKIIHDGIPGIIRCLTPTFEIPAERGICIVPPIHIDTLVAHDRPARVVPSG
ncbi:hypothetical protein ABG067_007595, partial [Albugo candida]